jgi:hypothetical protein
MVDSFHSTRFASLLAHPRRKAHKEKQRGSSIAEHWVFQQLVRSGHFVCTLDIEHRTPFLEGLEEWPRTLIVFVVRQPGHVQRAEPLQADS